MAFYCSIDRSKKGRVRGGILAPKVTWGVGEFRTLSDIRRTRVVPIWDSGEYARYTSSPWSIGIMNLAGSAELNPRDQRVRGKLLSRKELQCDYFFRGSRRAGRRLGRLVGSVLRSPLRAVLTLYYRRKAVRQLQEQRRKQGLPPLENTDLL